MNGDLSRANSRASARSRNGSTLSRNQSLIKKNIQLQDLKPADVLIERFVAWKAIVQQLTAYFEGIADIETNTAKELTKLAGVIQVPFRAGNQFLGEGGLQDVFYGIRDKTRIIADQHADLGRTVDSSIVQHLQKLRTEIKAHIKNVQNDTGKLAASVAKERETSTRLVGELANGVSTFKNTPKNLPPKSDPYIANQAVARQLQRQVLEENLLQKSIVMMQQNSAHFEEGIVRAIQSAWSTFDEWQSRASAVSQEIFRNLSTHLASLAPDREWIQFAARSDHLLDPETPMRDPQAISYPLKDDSSVIPVHTGHLERKKRFTRAYNECYFVLTPAGFLHEFPSSDPNALGALVPSFSLFLPSCTLGPVSSLHSKTNKFHIEGSKDGSGTTRSKSGSIKGFFKRGGDERQLAWSFRLKSREEMLEWWNDIKLLTARYLIASEQVERTGPAEAAVMSAGYRSEELEEEEEETAGERVEGEEGSSVEEEVEEGGPYGPEHTAPPRYQGEGQFTEVGPHGFVIDKKANQFPMNEEYRHPRHVPPPNLDEATMDPTSDEPPLNRPSRRLSKRQLEKAPQGIAEDYQVQQPQESSDHGRLPSQQQQQGDQHLPPPVPYNRAPPSPPPAPTPRFLTSATKASSENGNMKKATIIPGHVGGRHLSPPPPHRDTENDKEEAGTTGDGDDDKDEENESDMYTDDHRDVDVGPTEPVEGEPHRDESELGASNETQPTRDDEDTDVETDVLKGRGSLDNVAGSSDVHAAEEGDVVRD